MKWIVTILASTAVCLGLTPAFADNKLAAQISDRAARISQGQQVFERWCSACHARGPYHPGTASLAVAYEGNVPAALEERDDLTPEVVAHFVRNGVWSMPPFRKTEITDAELEALGAYLSRGQKP